MRRPHQLNTKCFAQLAIASILWIFALSSHGGISDQTTDNGKVRIHYPDSGSNNCAVVMLGVGTAMKTSSYDKLSKRIADYGHIAVTLDHAPGNMIKTDANKYRNLAEDVKDQLLNWISASSCNVVNYWIMGGHSAGGQAAQNAIANSIGLADGIFSIDPYNAKDTDPVNIPAMYWGFNSTTCFVTVDDAAKEAYKRSDDRRALYKVDTKYSWGPCGYSPKYFHCSFCDGHCPGCTNCKTTPDHFFDDVARSVDLFIQHGFSNTWSKANMSFNSTTPISLYTDSDQP